MAVLSVVIGIVALLGMFVGLVPCLGWFNWLNIPFALVGLILGFIAHQGAPVGVRGLPAAGLALNAVAVVLGAIRLVLGMGVI